MESLYLVFDNKIVITRQIIYIRDMRLKYQVSVIFCLFILSLVSVAAKPLALVYKGEGSCPAEEGSTGCSEAVAHIATLAGYEVQFVGPEGLQDSALWKKAQVWLQPGGRARKQILTMKPELLNQIRLFVKTGGGYVGFCAGGFLATEHFGWTDTDPQYSFESDALGLLPGNSRYYDLYDSELSEDHTAKILSVQWNGQSRDVYWELGPYFDSTTTGSRDIEVLAYYPTVTGGIDLNHAMTVRGQYGLGHVYVTSVHPEAPQDWRDYYKIQDRDGLDYQLAVDMVKWVQPKHSYYFK